MNITFLSTLLSRQGGGVQSAMLGLSGAINSQGHSTTAIGISDEALTIDQNDWEDTRVLATPMLGPSAFSYSGGLGASLKRSQTDLLHQHGLWCYPSIAGRRWAEAHLTPRVISPHNMLDSVSLKKGVWRKRIALKLYEKRNLDTAGCIHALVEKEGRDIRAQGFKAPICIVPNGIEVPQTQALPNHLSAIIKGQPYLLYLSRLTQVKQVLPLIEAWQQHAAKNQSTHWKLVIAGWGTDVMRQRVEAAVAASKLENLHFIGPVYGDEKHSLFAHAQAFLLPSTSEGLPMAVLEAMAHGTPVMVTEQCNLPDVAPAGAGICVRTDIQSIAAGIASITEMSESERKLMSRNARQLVRRSYTWDVAAAQMADVYQWLLGGGPRPTSVAWID